MLAFVGFVFTDFYTLPGFEYTTLEAHDACVASGAMSQLLLWIGLLEVVSFISIDQMLRGSGREPGDFGFDPIGFSSDPKVRGCHHPDARRVPSLERCRTHAQRLAHCRLTCVRVDRPCARSRR